MERKDHWEEVYRTKSADEVSWFQPSPTISLELIRGSGLPRDAALIDVGGGASRLVDALLDEGYSDLTVLDIAGSALARSRERLGSRAAAVEWLEADATTVALPKRYDLWHDRAVFHFLTSAEDRAAYLERLGRHLAPGGCVIVATFALDGPESCSGLPVQRYSQETLTQTLDSGLALEAVVPEVHTTPAGKTQSFVYCRFRRQP